MIWREVLDLVHQLPFGFHTNVIDLSIDDTEFRAYEKDMDDSREAPVSLEAAGDLV